MEKLKITVGGILAALLIIRMFHFFLSPVSYSLFVLFLAYTACVYFGAALSDMRSSVISIELMVSLLIFSVACIGLLHSPVWVAAGYILHGIWDMFHHPRLIKTKIIKWFPPACAIVDFIIATYILIFY